MWPKSWGAKSGSDSRRWRGDASRAETIVALVPMSIIGRGATFLKAADEHGHVRPLSAPIGVQFVEHEEPQAVARPREKTLIIRSDQDQFAP